MNRRAVRAGCLAIVAVLLVPAMSPSKSAATNVDTTPPTQPDNDQPFGRPYYLVHVTGHGTTQGGVEDDFWGLTADAPDGDGNFLSADGSGGTIGWHADSVGGPYNKPSEACNAVLGKIDGQGRELSDFNGHVNIDCSPWFPPLPTTTTAPPPTSPPTSDTTASTTDTSTPTTDQAPVCNVQGTVIDVFGDPVPGIHIQLTAGGETFDTATLDDGSYSFAEIGDNPGSGVFNSTSDQVQVSLLTQEWAHQPSRYEVYYRQVIPTLSTPPFMIPSDGNCNRDFDMRAIPDDYIATAAPVGDWPDVTQIYQGIHHAWALADMLNIDLSYGLPLRVLAWCDDPSLRCGGKAGAFFIGSASDNTQVVDRPYIAFAPSESDITSGNRPDNREYHEFGHFVQAAALGGIPDAGSDSVNHAGYANGSSADSWTEGFAEFWSLMVSKYIDGTPSPGLYHTSFGALPLSTIYHAWDWEELAVASALFHLDGLNSVPAPVVARAKRTYQPLGYTEVTDPTVGRLIVGRITNTTNGESLGTVAGAVFYDANNREIDASYNTTIPANLEPGGTGLFVIPVPKTVTTYKQVAIVAFEGRPAPPPVPQGAPLNITLAQIWAAISSYQSTKLLGSGHVYDVQDLYSALKAAFGGQGQTVGGLDAIDQVFIDAGFFDNSAGTNVYAEGATIGASSHVAFGDQTACQVPHLGCSKSILPRADLTGGPAQTATVSIVGPDGTAVANAQVLAQVSYPAPHEDQSYGYVLTPDADGSVMLAVPPPESGATITLIAVADGHTPAVIGTLDAATYWKQATVSSTSFLSFHGTLQKGDLTIPTGKGPSTGSPGSGRGSGAGGAHGGGIGAMSALILIAGLLIAVMVGAILGRRRRARAAR